MKKIALDATDIRSLGAVQRNCHLSKSKLAEIVNLSPTPCWTRLDKLKKAGLIRGCYAGIALELIGNFTKVIVTLSLANHRKSDFERFEDHVRKLDDVVECIATGDGTDYVMKVITPDLASFQTLMNTLLDETVRWGAQAFSVYNHIYIPRDFGDPAQNFWNLVNDAILCDVAVERQVEITGPDAARFVQMLTPRDLSMLAVG